MYKRQLYDGAEDAPDLVCVPAPGLDLKAKFDRTEVFGHFGRHGMHRPEDAFFFDSEGANPLRVHDVGQLVLAGNTVVQEVLFDARGIGGFAVVELSLIHI